MRIAKRGCVRPPAGGWLWKLSGLLAIWSQLAAATPAPGTEPSLTEYQVKALCLLNIAKYVEWPKDAFSAPNAPITIGIAGLDNFGDYLRNAVAGKTIAGRKLVIQSISGEEDWTKCHVLFVSASEKDRFVKILERVKGKPILTVGEAEGFRQKGGIINLVNKEGKVRFEINLSAARLARLQISSRLLGLADDVSGKQ